MVWGESVPLRKKMEIGKEFEGKKVYMKLKSGRIYTGHVLVYENHFYKIIDKFGARIIISEDEIELLQEEVSNER